MSNASIAPSNRLGFGRYLPHIAERTRLHVTSALVFALAVGGAFLAASYDRPITCALVFVFGVVIIGGLEGARIGSLVAITASIIYSFFIRDPAFSFSLTSADDLVPIFAFNLSAVASGIFTGWLKDRIAAAESATRRLEALLGISTALHSALKLDDITEALERFTKRPAELYIANGSGQLASLARSKHKPLADGLVARSENNWLDGSVRAYRFVTPSGAPCIAVLDVTNGDHLTTEKDVDAVVALLSVTVERCLLLGRAQDARVPQLRLVQPDG